MTVFRSAGIIGILTVVAVVASACGSGTKPVVPVSGDESTVALANTVVPAGTSTPAAFRPVITVELPSIGAETDEAGRPVGDVLRVAVEKFDVVTTYRSRSYQLGRAGTDAEVPVPRGFSEFQSPDRFRMLDLDGKARSIIIGELNYRLSGVDDEKWWLIENQPSLASLQLIRPFPDELAGAGFVELNDPDHYIIEGYAGLLTRTGVEIPPGVPALLRLHQMKIRRDSNEIASVTRWDIPLVIESDKESDLTQILVRQAEIKTMPRFVIELFDYDIDIDIQPPAESFAGAFVREPRDGDTAVLVATDISYMITRPVEIMELTISPSVELTFVEEEALGGPTVLRKFRPETPLKKSTKYTATFVWGASEDDLQTISWSFTTSRSGILSLP